MAIIWLISASMVPQCRAAEVDTVILDPGHGGIDSGITNGPVREKDTAMALARELQAHLAKKGKVVQMTRATDVNSTVTERRNTIRAVKAQILLSLHMSGSAQLVLTTAGYDMAENMRTEAERLRIDNRQRTYLDESRKLAGLMGSSLEASGYRKIARRELPLTLLRTSPMAAVMIELPLSGNYDAEAIRRISEAIAISVVNYEQP